jgi:hypothetical protein
MVHLVTIDVMSVWTVEQYSFLLVFVAVFVGGFAFL